MARTKQSARPGLGGREKEVMTWTRFHLPVDQEWPTWRDAKHADDVHRGPLAGLEGVLQAWLGRMVDDPEQAVYIVRELLYPFYPLLPSRRTCLWQNLAKPGKKNKTK